MIITAGILTLVAVAVPGQALAATGASSVSSSPSKTSCPMFDFIGARGSGQPDETSGAFRGLGPEVDKMVTVMEDVVAHKGHSTGITALNYPAVPVKVLIPTAAQIKLFRTNPAAALADWYNTNVKKFMGSIAKGVSAMVSYAEHETKACPGTAFVLAGYSQGAMVMHEAELQLRAAEEKGTSFAFGRIGGTILLADGYRVPNTKAKEFGTSKASGQGIATYLRHGVGDVAEGTTTANICDANDAVCNFGANLFLHIPSAISVHTSYAKCNAKNQCTYKAVLTTAATWVADKALP